MKMYHGDTMIDVHPSKVEQLEKNGWSKTPPKKKAAPAK